MVTKFLSKNDVVDVISPGTACTFDEHQKIKDFLQKNQLTPRIFLEKELSLKKPATHEFPSFEPKLRFEQFRQAIESDSKIIWCARGGYGSAEILSFLQKMKKPKTQKIFIGFSDISSLNKILIESWGWQVVTAPMLAQIVLKKVSPKSTKAILNFIFGKTTKLKYHLSRLSAVDCRLLNSTIVGGCLSVLAGNFGTKNQIDWHNKILFLEDEGEDGERLDRYFFQLITLMLEQKKYPSAIVFGNFMEANPHGTPKAKNIKIAIAKFVQNLQINKIPTAIFTEKTGCLGHSKNMLPLILGGEAKIDGNVLMQ